MATGEPLIVAPVINTVFKDTFAVDGSPLIDLGGVHLETLEFKWLPLSEKRRKDHPEYEKKKGKRKVQGVPQSQTAALPRHKEEEETDKSKQAQIEQKYEKH